MIEQNSSDRSFEILSVTPPEEPGKIELPPLLDDIPDKMESTPKQKDYDSYSPQEIRRMKPLELANLYLSSKSKNALKGLLMDPDYRHILMDVFGKILELRQKQNQLHELTKVEASKNLKKIIRIRKEVEGLIKDLYQDGKLPECFVKNEDFLYDIKEIRRQSISEPLVYEGEQIQIGFLQSHDSFVPIEINQWEASTPHTATISIKEIRTIIERYGNNPKNTKEDMNLLKTALRFAYNYTRFFTDQNIYLGGLQDFDPNDTSKKNYETAYANLRIITGFGQLLEEADSANQFNKSLAEPSTERSAIA